MLSDDEQNSVITRDRIGPDRRPSGPRTVSHYSEDGTIKRFAPHVPSTNPSHPPAVWAIDEQHAPLYWFPRDCPRISVWARTPDQRRALSETFDTEADRICAAETGWVDRIRDAAIYRYSFDATAFTPWDEADGQYISGEAAFPIDVEYLGDLIGLHVDADVELRFTPRLGALMDRMLGSGLPFSFVRIRDAKR
ncbi:MAG: DUF6886 family protein [Ilumatobacteraceae bacterium]